MSLTRLCANCIRVSFECVTKLINSGELKIIPSEICQFDLENFNATFT